MSLPPYICNPDGGRGAEAAGCGEKAGNAPTLIRNTDGYIDVSGSGTFLVVIDLNEDKVRKIIDLSEVKNPVFVQAGERENISSGESLPILFGKIKKWFADLKAVAFSGSYSDLSNKPEALKNPQALTFTGGVTGSYDGSKAKSVEIPKVPASLPANGGNADTVDEKHASDLQDYNNLTNKPTLGEAASKSVKDIILKAYPVGSIFISTSSTNPSSYFGGTWAAWGAGRVPVGIDTTQTEFNAVQKTGGAKTHTLTKAQIPSHTHTANHSHSVDSISIPASGAHKHTVFSKIFPFKVAADAEYGTVSDSEGGFDPDTSQATHTHTVPAHDTNAADISTGSAGSGSAHNNLQPYIVCYMWKRTA